VSDSAELAPGYWTQGTPPPNVRLGKGTLVDSIYAFKRFYSRRDPGLVVGAGCTMDGVHFAVGEEGRIEIGDYCHFTAAMLLCELEVRVGNHVVIGWNATIADTDFHPIEPAERIADAIACSPLGKGHPRPEIVRRAVIIEDGVWIGPNAAILKGVRLGAGCWIEPGALVVHDVPARTRAVGNPARLTAMP
jgi:acetyltransferase-like isoleucine patch superfamily enzyme